MKRSGAMLCQNSDCPRSQARHASSQPISAMNKLLRKIVLISTLLGSMLTLPVRASESQAELQGHAKITQAQAEKTALARVPDGKIQSAELEREDGKLVWSFDLARPGTKDITEVQVDAQSGEIVSVENETPKQQEQEKQADQPKP